MALDERVRGATGNIFEIFVQNAGATNGAGLTGLVFNAASLTAYYKYDVGTAAVAITLANITTIGTFANNGLREVDATNMPGVYEFNPPNAAFSNTTAKSVTFMLKGATNMAPVVFTVALKGIDTQNATTSGIGALPNATPGNAAGGLMILGTNNQAVTFSAGLTISNAGGDGLTLSSSGSNGNGLNASGNGSGAGVKATGGATGHGISATGGATSGSGISAVAASSGDGVTATGVGTTKHGINATGGSTSSDGIRATGGGTGHGVNAQSGSGATGNGILANSNATNGNGLAGTGHGTGDGITGTGGAGLGGDGIAGVAGGGVDIRGGITGDITGNLSGSAGSVTGAVGSVTGNVGGNVVGSVGSVTGAVGSVTGAVGSVTGNVGGNVTGSVGSLGATAKTDVEDAVWDATLANHLDAGSTGEALNAAGAAGDPWTTALPGAYGAGSAGFIIGNNLDASVADVEADTQDIQTRLPAALTAGGKIKASMDEILAGGQSATDLKDFADTGYDPATHKVAEVVLTDTATALGAAYNAAKTAAQAGDAMTLTAAYDAAKTAAQAGDAMTLTAGERQAVADAWTARNIAGGSSAGRTNGQCMATLRNKQAIVAGVYTCYETDDSTPLFEANVTTAAGDPLASWAPTS